MKLKYTVVLQIPIETYCRKNIHQNSERVSQQNSNSIPISMTQRELSNESMIKTRKLQLSKSKFNQLKLRYCLTSGEFI